MARAVRQRPRPRYSREMFHVSCSMFYSDSKTLPVIMQSVIVIVNCPLVGGPRRLRKVLLLYLYFIIEDFIIEDFISL